jgi:hypothetical protein
MRAATPLHKRNYSTPTPPERMSKYVNGISPFYVKDTVKQVLKPIKPGYKNYNYAAKLVEYIHENIRYESSEKLYRPDYLINQRKKGDCEDQSIALASMLIYADFEIRIVVVNKKRDETGHVFLEALFPDADMAEIYEQSAQFYNDDEGVVSWEKEEDEIWMPCDPTATELAGSPNDYFDVDRYGQVDWHPETQKDLLYPGREKLV